MHYMHLRMESIISHACMVVTFCNSAGLLVILFGVNSFSENGAIMYELNGFMTYMWHSFAVIV